MVLNTLLLLSTVRDKSHFDIDRYSSKIFHDLKENIQMYILFMSPHPYIFSVCAFESKI